MTKLDDLLNKKAVLEKAIVAERKRLKEQRLRTITSALEKQGLLDLDPALILSAIKNLSTEKRNEKREEEKHGDQ